MSNLDLTKDGVYIVKDGECKRVTDPNSGFGKQTIVWQNGKVNHCEITFTEK
ncbi:DUF3954 domain-containing protein [Bacillus weihaiensis]|uniref:DUF3954 domain-containing protein n=1 Tax=Bacillus weihaiensis TaxID=1547283 RepID=A0A1L3MXZ2_9BACI|nr:DUF3954 domain-containing protein [Bacillus weihaiensis]APH07211.1 DUF3954 domain-containing protein [Bacillus weihaiensis]